MFFGKRVQRYTFSVNWQNVFVFFFQKEADFSRLFDKGQGKRAIEWGKTCGKTAGHSKGAEGVREGVRRGAGYYIQINVRVRMCDEFISYML